jgi:hypothetical protein
MTCRSQSTISADTGQVFARIRSRGWIDQEFLSSKSRREALSGIHSPVGSNNRSVLSRNSVGGSARHMAFMVESAILQGTVIVMQTLR